ncbi:hypothetical protein J31TS4_36820 [Paenibacillus sp. J31TS4]|uniref:DsrE family protein n=1 Tax=Paenibacillus sp. J31TS4 TaxID=2807195 RepID=UPI001B2E24CE|nr:DsrE family protein [Paenibacillus sp. J31TS4]GIP40402.1 hypothetical protein J31TS4_36820 [Paenibacillus sp. J31TS4]
MKNKVILLLSDRLGSGDADLGETVLETFFVLLKQNGEKPAAVFCMNRGVFALTGQSLASLHLKELEEAGVAVLACKTCVNHYGLAEELEAGQIVGMDQFLELANRHEVLTLA